jgi:hypothetical protein
MDNPLLTEWKLGNEDEKAKTIYATFGLVMYRAQVLEKTFEIMLMSKRLVNSQITSRQDWEDICDVIEHSRKTMGNMLHEVKAEYSLEQTDSLELRTLLQTRNYFAHKFFKVNSAKWFSRKGQEEMMIEMLDFIERVDSIDTKLETYMAHYRSKLGITQEKIDAMQRDLIAEEQNK